MNYGFIKTACATPTIKVADCIYNSEQIISQITLASQNNAAVVLFPQLCVTGYTCGDLFLQNFLIENAEKAVEQIVNRTRTCNIVSVIGAPVAVDDKLYNCAVVIYQGAILGIVPKTNIPNCGEFYEGRYFSSYKSSRQQIVDYAGFQTPFSPQLVFCCNQQKEFKFAIEIGQDLQSPVSPSNHLVLDGKATVILNLSSDTELAGMSQKRVDMIRMHSAKLKCAYLYANSGPGESTTDAVYSAHNIICEDGEVLRQSDRLFENIIYADIDVEKIVHERRKLSNFEYCYCNDDLIYINFDCLLKQPLLDRAFSKHPFIPDSKDELDKRCGEILSTQAMGLATRMMSASVKELVIGVSGGLDSTLALIVSVKALDILGLPHSNLHAVSMPCFGTTRRTKSNAEKLALAYGAKFANVNITRSVRQHFADIGHDETKLDTTYENAQARQRTLVLMDLSNKFSALVVGTGDLSELALGWATYNGDHMSMYGVNSSVPKTMVRHLVEYEAERSDLNKRKILTDILNTPISPELLPPDVNGEITQVTEDVVGPYELHDFFLYYFVRYGFSPEKIFYLALRAFDGCYDRYTIKKWMQKFFARFFSQQFKRSCMPDGPKVGVVNLSPRGDFRMPSDAQARIWLERINEL